MAKFGRASPVLCELKRVNQYKVDVLYKFWAAFLYAPFSQFPKLWECPVSERQSEKLKVWCGAWTRTKSLSVVNQGHCCLNFWVFGGKDHKTECKWEPVWTLGGGRGWERTHIATLLWSSGKQTHKHTQAPAGNKYWNPYHLEPVGEYVSGTDDHLSLTLVQDVNLC